MTARIVRDGALYRIEGPVTMANVESLLQAGRSQFDGARVSVDLGGVTEADSSALSLLLQWARDGASQGRRMAFTNLPTGLQSLAVLYGIDELFPTLHDSTDPRA
ncbi:MAG: STAS domain-containing protein [Burkholderiales bacterium]|nr:STAS domain-containing protein [Burkholderiales bacterium]